MNKKLQADNAALRAEKQVKKLNSYKPRERKRKILKISTAHVRSLWKMMELFFLVSVQEVMKALQKTHHLLLTQTQTLRRVELELQAQNEQYQVRGSHFLF